MEGKPRLVFIPSYGAGHFAPAVEMAKRLADRFSITVLTMPQPNSGRGGTVTSTSVGSVTTSALDIEFIELPPIDYSSLGEGQGGLVVRLLSIDAYKPIVKTAVADLLLKSPFIAGMILDVFCTGMIDVAVDLGIPPYLYFTSNAANLSLFLYFPTLDALVPDDMADVAARGEYIHVPGLDPIPPLAMPAPMLSKKSEMYPWILGIARRLQEVKGFIVNTFTELEPGALQALSDGRCLPEHPTLPVYAVGPVLSVQESHDEPECIKWLNMQPPKSVVFLCFGSMGSFDKEQATEMALGLERSGHRFLWCLRSRAKEKSGPLEDTADLDELLPREFLERTEGRGMVWPAWAPQAAILQHEAVGGFVSHCGWNSCLESVWTGVPVLAWPMYAEQHFNAVEMVRTAGVAVKMRFEGGKGMAEEVERGVRSLMGEDEEGKRVRERAMEARRLARKALEPMGSSFMALENLVSQLRLA